MPAASAPLVAPTQVPEVRTEETEDLDPGFLVVCWNDPVNLMDYVTHVFQVVFNWQRQKAEHHMLEVHNRGRSVLTREGREKAEHYVHQLHRYGLHATMEQP
jgi:ATP-dependent Clp protease adaptor protein ClpS